MSGVILSFLGGWWVRLFGRTAAARPEAPVTVVPQAPSTESPVGAERMIERVEARKVAAQSLAETLGVEALPRVMPQAAGVDPQVRDRTLAALANLQQIPALQSLARGFTQAMNRPDVAIGEVVAAIAKDSALCVRVLRQANSVLVSPERKIEDLDSAVMMLGVKRVRQAANALFTLRDARRVADGFDWRHLWIHALATAAVAEELEKHLRARDDSQLHLAALLHDVGKIVLATIAPEDYRDILVMAWNERAHLEDLERARLGVSHREAGVIFARHNHLPEVVIAAIGHHDQPDAAGEHRFDVALVALANHVSKAHGLGFSGARVEEGEGDFADLPAWKVVTEECGARPDIALIEQDLEDFTRILRMELRELHEAT